MHAGIQWVSTNRKYKMNDDTLSLIPISQNLSRFTTAANMGRNIINNVCHAGMSSVLVFLHIFHFPAGHPTRHPMAYRMSHRSSVVHCSILKLTTL